MIKLIAIDLDGSLLSDDKELPDDFWEVANALFERGIALTIASGRPFHNIASVFDRIRDRLYFACDNGSYLVHKGEEWLIRSLTPETVAQFVNISRPIPNVYPVLCSRNIAYLEDREEEFKQQVLTYYQEYEMVEDLTKVSDTIIKISLCDLKGAETNSYPYYQQFDKEFKVVVAADIWLDITHKEGSKGNAIKEIQRRLEITPDETLVFGDYLNDLDMILDAKYSYAMKNAHPRILEAASFITELDNNQGGVTHTIKQLLKL